MYKVLNYGCTDDSWILVKDVDASLKLMGCTINKEIVVGTLVIFHNGAYGRFSACHNGVLWFWCS